MHSKNEKLTFVLTLALSGTGRDNDDLQRVGLMFSSFSQFFDEQGLEEFIVVTPAEDEEKVRASIHTGFNQQKLRILDETVVCPEILDDPETLSQWPKPNKGWYRQQLIKLAIHKMVKTQFYLTVDSDVLFTKPFSVASLIKDKRALLNTQCDEDYKQLYCNDIATKEVRIRRERYKNVEKILKYPRMNQFLNHWYGETPVLLSKDIAEAMSQHIEHVWNQPWRQTLLRMLPWTEYALYFQYAEQSGLLEKYYHLGDMNTLLNLSDSLWRPAIDYRNPRNLANWDVDRVFSGINQGVAVVVQSYLGYSVTDVSRKIQRYINTANL